MRSRSVSLALVVGMILGGGTLVNAQQVPVKVVALTTPVRRGAVATLSIRTSPGALCTPVLEVRPGSTTGLGKKTADAKGGVQWSWRVRTDAAPGSRPLSITCTLKDKVSIAQLSLVVR